MSYPKSSNVLRATILAGTVGSIAILSGPIQAATFVWDNDAGNLLWGTETNWNPDGLPIAEDTVTFSNTTAGIFGNVSLGDQERSVSIINFTANTSDRYRLVPGANLALGFLSGVTQINQTADDSNEVQVRVRAGDGTGVLSSNVTSNNLQLQQRITSGGLIKTGGGTLRFGTSGTNFQNEINGDILLNGGTLTASGGLADGSNNPLGGTGKVVIGAGGVTLRLDFSNLGAAGNAGTFDFVRDIEANNNSFTLHVDRAAGSANGGTSRAGVVTIGNATMTVNQGNGFTAHLDGLRLNDDASAVIAANTNVRTDDLRGNSGTTLQKNGGSTLFLTAPASAEFQGAIRHNGGTIQVEGAAGISAIDNASGITFVNSGTLNLRSAESMDFGVPISFGPGVVSSTISVDRMGAAATNQVLSFGELTIGGSGLVNDSTRVLTINGANGYTFAADGVTIGAGEVGALNMGVSGTAPVLTTGAGSTFEKRGGGTLVINGDNSATSSATIKVLGGSLDGNAAGAFGTGVITVGTPAVNTAGFIPAEARVRYGAAGASANATGADVIAIAGGVIDLNAVPNATDIFDVRADARIQGDTAQLAALTIGTNLTVAENAVIVHDNPGAATGTVNNLANTASLFYGIANTANTLPDIGAGTPWKGISADNVARTIQGLDAANPALINIRGGDSNPDTVEATFQAMFNGGTGLTFGSNYQFVSTVGGQKVTLGIDGRLGSTAGLVPGALVRINGAAATNGLAANVDKIIISGGGLLLDSVGGLGGVPVEVRNNGVFDITSLGGNVIDGDVTFKSGGVFLFNDPQKLEGSGTLTFESGSKLDINGAPATFFTDATQTMNFAGNNYTVRFSANELAGMDAKIPNAGVTYVVTNGAAAAVIPQTNVNATMNTQSAGLTLENGTLTNDGSSRGFSGPINLNNTNLTVAATRNTSFVVTSGISTTGDVQVGSPTAIDNRDKTTNSGNLNGLGMPDPYNSPSQVIFLGAFSAGNVTATNSHLAFASADTTIGGKLTINGGVLYLDGGGPVNASNQGELTGKISDGSLAESITLGNYSRMEMKLILGSDSNATALEIDTPIIIDGDVNPQDNRRMWVSRQSGSNTRVNFNDITMKAGSAFALDEDNTDIRATFKLEGDATIFRGAHDDFHFIDVTRSPVAGANPVTLTLGRVNATGISGFNNTVSNVYGELGEGVEVNIVRGQLFFQPGSEINGVIRTQTAAVGGDSFVVSSASSANTNTEDSTIGGTGRIELGRSAAANNAEDFEIRGTETTTDAGAAPLHTHAGEIRVIDDGTAAIDGIVRSNRANDSNNAARVRVEKIVLTNDATVQLASSNSIPLTVGDISLTGNGTIDTASANMTIEKVTAGANAVSFTGGSAPTVLEPLSAGKVTSANANFNDSVTATTDVNVSGGTTNFSGNVTAPVVNVATGNAKFSAQVLAGSTVVDQGSASFAGNVSGSVTVKTSAATFDPGFGTDQTVGGPVHLELGTMRVASGTVDLGANGITSTTSATTTVAGLREHLVTNASFDEQTPNLSNNVRLGPVMAQRTTGWGSNETYVYTGEFFVPNSNGDGTGSFAFAENFDDNVRVDIDGVEVLRNTAWNNATSTGVLQLESGWHAIEMRFGQGTGGAGPNNNDGWNTTLGFGLDLTSPIDESVDSPVMANFVAPVDDGTMNLFRTTVRSEVSVASDSVLKTASMSNVGSVAFTGGGFEPGVVELSGAGASSAGALSVSAGASGTLRVLNSAATMTVGSLNNEGDLTKSGPGALYVSGGGAGVGGVTVEAGTFGGNAAFEGQLIATGGTISPGIGAGRMTVGGFDLQTPATLKIELNGAAAGTGYDQILLSDTALDGVSLGGSLEATLGYITNVGDVFLIILNGGTTALDGKFANAPTDLQTVMVSGLPFTIDYGFDGNGDGVLNDVALIAQVPEPTSLLALLGGGGMLAGLRRFRRRA